MEEGGSIVQGRPRAVSVGRSMEGGALVGGWDAFTAEGRRGGGGRGGAREGGRGGRGG